MLSFYRSLTRWKCHHIYEFGKSLSKHFSSYSFLVLPASVFLAYCFNTFLWIPFHSFCHFSVFLLFWSKFQSVTGPNGLSFISTTKHFFQWSISSTVKAFQKLWPPKSEPKSFRFDRVFSIGPWERGQAPDHWVLKTEAGLGSLREPGHIHFHASAFWSTRLERAWNWTDATRSMSLCDKPGMDRSKRTSIKWDGMQSSYTKIFYTMLR